jgi:thiopeptide-type bacteriocin biosynthesis protein
MGQMPADRLTASTDPGPWLDLRVVPADWNQLDHLIGRTLLPAVESSPATRAWFLRKHPCVRLRLRDADPAATTAALDRLTGQGHIVRWWQTIYEPETTAFGGDTAMTIIHGLFIADSAGVAAYLNQPQPVIGRRELSLLLLDALMAAAGLDWFERGDVYAKVAALRPLGRPPNPGLLEASASRLRPSLAATSAAGEALFGATGPLRFAHQWRHNLQHHGSMLGHAAASGQTSRGLRAILAHVLIFHWNRLGLTATTQAALARTAQTAYLPPELT